MKVEPGLDFDKCENNRHKMIIGNGNYLKCGVTHRLHTDFFKHLVAD